MVVEGQSHHGRGRGIHKRASSLVPAREDGGISFGHLIQIHLGIVVGGLGGVHRRVMLIIGVNGSLDQLHKEAQRPLVHMRNLLLILERFLDQRGIVPNSLHPLAQSSVGNGLTFSRLQWGVVMVLLFAHDLPGSFGRSDHPGG